MKFKRKLAIIAALSVAVVASGCKQAQPQPMRQGQYVDSWQDTDQGTAICVDPNGYRVDDDYCEDGRMGFVPLFFSSSKHAPKYGYKADKRYSSKKRYLKTPFSAQKRPAVRNERPSYRSTSSSRNSYSSRSSYSSSRRR